MASAWRFGGRVLCCDIITRRGGLLQLPQTGLRLAQRQHGDQDQRLDAGVKPPNLPGGPAHGGQIMVDGGGFLDHELRQIGFVSNFNTGNTSGSRLALNTDGTGGDNGSDITTFDMTKWTFFAITYDGTITSNNVKFYLGGTDGTSLTLVGTRTNNTGTLETYTATTPALIIGNNGGSGRQFDGLMDNIALYGSMADASGALAQSQVQDLYSSQVPEPTSALLLPLMGMLALARSHRARH